MAATEINELSTGLFFFLKNRTTGDWNQLRLMLSSDSDMVSIADDINAGSVGSTNGATYPSPSLVKTTPIIQHK